MLDEIDQLITANQEVLYRIYEMPLIAGLHCCIIGIANTLDLASRFLPRLQSRNCKSDVRYL
jgi:cell division control protein 6